MDTSLERIKMKIADMEAKLINLKITERELLAFEKTAARQIKTPGPKPKTK